MRRELNRRLMEQSGLGAGAATFETYDETVFSRRTGRAGPVPRAASWRPTAISAGATRTAFPTRRRATCCSWARAAWARTFLMQCIARRVAERGHLPTYISAYRFFETARQALSGQRRRKARRPLMEAELLLIDDLGTEPLMNNVTVTQLFKPAQRAADERAAHHSQHQPEHERVAGALHRARDLAPSGQGHLPARGLRGRRRAPGTQAKWGRKREHSDLRVKQKTRMCSRRSASSRKRRIPIS